jgi:small redox-active disulfide protein 2
LTVRKTKNAHAEVAAVDGYRPPLLPIAFIVYRIIDVKEMLVMSLFGKKNKKEKTPSCGCAGNCDAGNTAKAEKAKTECGIKVLGSGCAKCNQLEAATKEALQQLGMDTTIDHVTDFSEIAAYGVMTTPALVIDGKVVSYGKVLKTDEVSKILQKVRG